MSIDTDVRTPEVADLNTLALVLCVAFPWVWPIAGGPTAQVLPWLVSASCATLIVMLATLTRVNLPRASALGWMLAALLSSAIALLQYFGKSPALAPWVNVAPLGEAFGNLRQRNQFATLTNLGLAVALFGFATSRFSAHSLLVSAPMRWPIIVASTILLATANAATLSRTGMLQLMALGVLWLLWRADTPRRSGRVLATAVLAFAVASILLPILIGRDPFTDGIGSRFRDPELACAGRMLLWQNILHLIAQKPWWGWGWGEVSYAHFITLYPDGRFCDILDNAHNLPLHLAVVWGIPVALLMCGLVAIGVLRARPWCETVPARQLAWAVLAIVGLHSMLEYPLWYGPFQIATVLAIWMLWHTRPSVTHTAPDSNGPTQTNPHTQRATPWTIPVLMCAVLSLVALAYAAWDYHRISQVYKAPSLRSSEYQDDTLRKVQGSWLFRNQVRFAMLTLSTVTPENALNLNTMARQLLHFSPETRVVEKLIDSELVLGRTDEAAYYMLRYRNAFPAEYARWEQRASYGLLPKIDP